MDEITFPEQPYARMFMRNLLDETEEMKWKLLDYHNQDFVLACSVDTRPYTEEGHRKFLESLPGLKRRHYIVYFDGRAIGKHSYDIEEGRITDSSTFFFHREDIMSGLGVLWEAFILRFSFEYLKVESYAFSVRKDNKPMMSAMKRLAQRVREDEILCYFEITREAFPSCMKKLEPLLPYCLQ